MIVWVNGHLRGAGEPALSAVDHGITVGNGVFETLRVYDGHPFEWGRHDARLRRSAAGLDLEVPPVGVLLDAATTVLDANGLREARLRITVTGGPAPLGSARGDASPTVIVAAGELAAPSPTAAVVVVPWTRNERSATAGLKTISYADNVRALAYANERGASEAIFANTRDELCEGTGSNVFLIRGGAVATPPESSGCLAGVSRAVVLELCADLGIAVAEAPLPIHALAAADAAFLTSSTREVQAISHVDGAALRAAPDPVTERLAVAFRTRTRTLPV